MTIPTNLGSLIAICVLIATVLLVILGLLPPMEGSLVAALALARLT